MKFRSGVQIPVKSTLPSAVRGVGADFAPFPFEFAFGAPPSSWPSAGMTAKETMQSPAATAARRQKPRFLIENAPFLNTAPQVITSVSGRQSSCFHPSDMTVRSHHYSFPGSRGAFVGGL